MDFADQLYLFLVPLRICLQILQEGPVFGPQYRFVLSMNTLQ